MAQALPLTDQIAYGFEHESWESKVDWFGGLTPAERLRHLDQIYRLAVGLNPKLREGNDAGHPASTLRVLELPRR